MRAVLLVVCALLCVSALLLDGPGPFRADADISGGKISRLVTTE